MDSPDQLDALCHQIADELRDLAVKLASRDLNDEQFIAAVLRLEAAKVSQQGFTLSASNTLDDWTRFTIRRSDNRTVCAAFEFLPDTGEFRRAQDLSYYHAVVGA